MERRDLLKAVGAASVPGMATMAGCGVVGCGPGADSIGEVAGEMDRYNVKNKVRIEGEVYDTDPTPTSLLVDDTTGKALVFPKVGYAFHKDLIDESDCVTVIGEMDVEKSRSSNYDLVVVANKLL